MRCDGVGFHDKVSSILLTEEFAKQLDVAGTWDPGESGNTTYMGMDALHSTGGLGKLPVDVYYITYFCRLMLGFQAQSFVGQ